MKRVINNFSIYSGISIDDDKNVVFNWDRDTSTDVMSLCRDRVNTFNSDGIRVLYGYRFKSNANREQRKKINRYLKTSSASDDNVVEFVENAILRLDTLAGLSNFDVCVHVEPTSSDSLVAVMGDMFAQERFNLQIDFETVKRIIHEVQFDSSAAYQSLLSLNFHADEAKKRVDKINRKFEKLKEENKVFEIKNFLPTAVRPYFHNFLKFRTKSDEEAYRKLEGCNVLVYDDFYTSGTTIKELTTYLKSINPKNTLTVFVLVKS